MTETATVGVLAFAASAGVTTFFAPCAFPLLPGYVGYYLTESDGPTRLLSASGAAAGGALGALAAVAVLVLSIGQPVKRLLPVVEPVAGVGLVGFGVLLLLQRGPDFHVPLPDRPTSLVGFATFGAVYALAAAGCVVPLFLGVVTQALAVPVQAGALVLGVYALAVTAPLAGVTLLAGVGVDTWQSAGAYARRIQQAGAVVMILAGVGQLYLAVVVLNVL